MPKAIIYRDSNDNELECEKESETLVSLSLRITMSSVETSFYLNKADLINLARDLEFLSKQLQPDGTDSNDS